MTTSTTRIACDARSDGAPYCCGGITSMGLPFGCLGPRSNVGGGWGRIEFSGGTSSPGARLAQLVKHLSQRMVDRRDDFIPIESDKI